MGWRGRVAGRESGDLMVEDPHFCRQLKSWSVLRRGSHSYSMYVPIHQGDF